MEFKNLKVYQPDGSFRTGSLTISGDRISAAEPTAEAVDMGGLYAVPGLVDLHFHGCVGYDFCDGTHEAISAIARYQAQKIPAGPLPTITGGCFSSSLPGVGKMYSFLSVNVILLS